MPHDLIGAADGTKSCPNETCRGYVGRPMAVELRVRYWTRKIGDGPVSIAKSDRLPIVVEERHRLCEHCGAEKVIGPLVTKPHYTILWPVPAVRPGMPADEVLPDPAPPPSLEERVAVLESRAR